MERNVRVQRLKKWKDKHVLLSCDFGKIFVGKEQLPENITLCGGGDWDFILCKIPMEYDRNIFDTIICAESIKPLKINNWENLCNMIGFHFGTNRQNI